MPERETPVNSWEQRAENWFVGSDPKVLGSNPQ